MVVSRGEVVLAPMAGYTHSAFRRLARRLGADRTYTELISAPGLIHRGFPLKLIYHTAAEAPIHVQIFGRNAEEISEAALKVALRFKPAAVDVNFGCSVPKVLKTGAAGKLLENPKEIKRIVERTKELLKPTGVKLTAKIRLGLKEDRLEEIAQALFEGGVDAVALHPRLGSEGFSGRARWERLRDLKKISPVPVVGSGDVFSAEDARRMFEETGVDAVMVGRAALTDPWIFKEIKEGTKVEVPLRERLLTVLNLLREMFFYYPSRERACFEVRAILVKMIKGFKFAAAVKARLMPLKDCGAFERELERLALEGLRGEKVW